MASRSWLASPAHLMRDAKCLLLDEPMAGVEGQSYAAMQRIVREVAEQGVAVCIVEHNVAFIKDLCDEGVFMFSAPFWRAARSPTSSAILSSLSSISGISEGACFGSTI
jgi:branched-chain amino acid transport system ATP-binding protein